MNNESRLLFSIMLLSVFGFSGCTNQKTVKKTPEPEVVVQPTQSTPQVVPAPEARIETVYFDFDRAVLKPEARAALKRNISYLRTHRDLRVLVEGRCDDRGTQEYNLALGQRRATVVEQFYRHAGIKSSRLSSISYGKERLICAEDNESCWAQNRQADGVLSPSKVVSK